MHLNLMKNEQMCVLVNLSMLLKHNKNYILIIYEFIYDEHCWP